MGIGIGIAIRFQWSCGQGGEVNHSPLSSAEVKNEWSNTSTSPACLHGVESESFIVTVFFSHRIHNARQILQIVMTCNFDDALDMSTVHSTCTIVTREIKSDNAGIKLGDLQY
jgi:hypothetical protein